MTCELVLMLMFNYPEVVVWRDGDGVEELASPTVPQADLVLNNNGQFSFMFLQNHQDQDMFKTVQSTQTCKKFYHTWSAQQTKFPSKSRET